MTTEPARPKGNSVKPIKSSKSVPSTALSSNKSAPGSRSKSTAKKKRSPATTTTTTTTTTTATTTTSTATQPIGVPSQEQNSTHSHSVDESKDEYRDDDLLAPLPPLPSLPPPKEPPQPQRITLNLIRKLNQQLDPGEDGAAASPDEIAERLLESKVIHLEYSNIHQLSLDGCFDAFNNVRELYLQYNSIKAIGEGLLYCNKLQLLTLHNNEISEVEGLSHLHNLEILDLSNNKINTCDYEALPPNLRILNLAKNECVLVEGHRRKACRLLTGLLRLDGEDVGEDEHDENDCVGGTKLRIYIDLEEDDGSEASGTWLPFSPADDLWVVADVFCLKFDIEGSLSRRQLVAMMRREARERGIVIEEGEREVRERRERASPLTCPSLSVPSPMSVRPLSLSPPFLSTCLANKNERDELTG